MHSFRRLARTVGSIHTASVALTVTACWMCAARVTIAQVCPAGSYYINDAQGSVSWNQPTLDARYTDGIWTSKASYDATTGDLALSLTPSDLSQMSVAVGDSFELVGLAAGTHVTVNAILDVSGWVSASGDCDTTTLVCDALLGAAEFNAFFISSVPLRVRSGSTGAVSRSAEFALTLTGGQRSSFNYSLRLSREGLPASLISSTATAHLHFTGLPAGMQMASCWGFGASATPAARATWGQLKMRYR
jgi:hypothetical protein